MKVRYTGGGGWKVTDDQGREFDLTRGIETGGCFAVCTCGAHYDERYERMQKQCPHMAAIEDHIEARAKACERDTVPFFGE